MCKNLRQKEDIKALAEGTKELPCEPGVCDLYMGDDGLSEPTAEDWTIARERGLAEGRTRGTEVVPIYGLADAPLKVAIVGGHGSGKSAVAVVHSFLDGTFWQGTTSTLPMAQRMPKARSTHAISLTKPQCDPFLPRHASHSPDHCAMHVLHDQRIGCALHAQVTHLQGD